MEEGENKSVYVTFLESPVFLGPLHRHQELKKFRWPSRLEHYILFKNPADINMTEGHRQFVQFAETHAQCGKKNFTDVDILLKSWLIFATC